MRVKQAMRQHSKVLPAALPELQLPLVHCILMGDREIVIPESTLGIGVTFL